MNAGISSISLVYQLKIKALIELLKLRLSLLVTFSSAFGYLLGNAGKLDWEQFMWFCVGGFFITGSSVTINQILEKKFDRLMKRTVNRPLPTDRITKSEAIWYSIFLAITGSLILLNFTNILTLVLAVSSLILYAFIYTPLKRVGPIAVFVGAIPGALPPLIGWAAATNMIGHEALIIFGIQFIWQFPHFWAIAWVSDDDYKRAGFKLLPAGGKKDLNTAINIMIYTLFLLPLGLLPSYFGLTGITSGVIATICGVLFLSQTFQLMKDNSRKSALKIMFSSFVYLPIVQIAYLVDKI